VLTTLEAVALKLEKALRTWLSLIYIMVFPMTIGLWVCIITPCERQTRWFHPASANQHPWLSGDLEPNKKNCFLTTYHLSFEVGATTYHLSFVVGAGSLLAVYGTLDVY
jgi:hypothetical protein